METFLQQTARSIISTIDWNRLSHVTLVLPSHRAGLVLKDEILRLQRDQQQKAVWAPQVQTLNQLQDSLSPLYPEDELFTIVRLYRHYRRLNACEKDLMPLDMFYGWGRQMLADFTNVDASMPAQQVPNFFANTIAAHELEQWKLDPEVQERLSALINPGEKKNNSADSIKTQYEHLWRQIYELYTALRDEMQTEQKGYSGLRQRAVIEHWDDYVQEKISGRTFVFVGFNYLLPVERELMERLRDAGNAMFYWDYVADFQTNEKAFSFAKLNSGILGNALPPQSWTEPREVTVMSCVSREAQAQYVHSWLKNNYSAKGQKVGVVICDESMLEPVIYTLPALVLPGESVPEPVNITKGFPLRNTVAYARVMSWLNDTNRGKADDAVAPQIIDQMLAELFEISLHQEADETNPDQPEVAQTSLLQWQELLLLESEYQVRKVANQMRLLITNGLGDVPFTLKLLRLLMRRTMESVTMPFHGEPVTDVQVMGVLETRMLDFDNLLLLNVEEGVLPQKQPDISFIPFYLRKAYHMQTSDERATVYAYNFFRLLSRARHTTLLYATAETAEGGKGMSRFIMQILYSPEFNVQKAALQEPSILRSSIEGDLTVTCPEPPRKFTSLSPSALNTFISCPLSFYRQYILGLRPDEEEDVVFAPNTLGSFVHHAMQYIYTEFLGCDNKSPNPVKPDEIESVRTDEGKMQEALDAAYKAMNTEYAKNHPLEPEHYNPDHHVGENVVIKGYVNNILERDSEDAKAGLQIYLLEARRDFSISIDGVGDITLGGFIDRLDIYGPKGAQYLRVVDYKSGGYNEYTHAKKMSSSWEDLMESDEKGYVRQTLIYSHAVMVSEQRKKGEPTEKMPIEPNLYFCRRKLTDIITTIDINNETVHDYAAIHEPFLEELTSKVKQVVTATQFPPCEEGKCPSFCPFFNLCGRKPTDF